MVHVSEISAEKRINHPQDVLKLGQPVKALVLAIDTEKRQLRLSLKQLVPTGLDEYIAEHKVGDVVSGRLVDITGENARVELGEGTFGRCQIKAEAKAEAALNSAAKADLSSLTSMLQAQWKSGVSSAKPKSADLSVGQVRSFRISKLSAAEKQIELELA
jgi:small subunit ribosomal protein S1